MNKIITNISMLFALTILLGNISFGQKVGTTSFQFLSVSPDARGAAMAGAFSSVARNAEAVYWNPAGLTSVNNFDLSVSYLRWFFDINHYSFAAAYNLSDFGTIAIEGLYTDIGEIEVTTVGALGNINGSYNPGLTGEVIHPHQSAIGISYAKSLTDKFAFGITAKYAYEDLVVESKGSFLFDGGLLFNTGFRTIKIAASIRQFGPDIKYLSNSYPLPQTFNIGISGYVIAPTDGLIANAAGQKLLVSYDMIQPRDYDQQHGIGMEYSFNDMIFLRGGYRFNGDQQGVAGGLGIMFNNYNINYSYTDYGEFLKAVHRFTIGFNLN